MKKVVALILLFSLNAAAAEVTKFEPRPAAVEQEGDTYVGILLSEEDFRKILEKKIDTKDTDTFFLRSWNTQAYIIF